MIGPRQSKKFRMAFEKAAEADQGDVTELSLLAMHFCDFVLFRRRCAFDCFRADLSRRTSNTWRHCSLLNGTLECVIDA
jgi:hypothetical protein